MSVPKDVTYDRVFYAVPVDKQAVDQREAKPLSELNPMLVICPRIYKTQENERRVEWSNTGRLGGEFRNVAKIAYIKYHGQEVMDREHPPKEIKITLENGNIFSFRRLTLAVYEQMNCTNKPKFNDEEELQKYYKDTDFEYESLKLRKKKL
jgi:hypothetical protein